MTSAAAVAALLGAWQLNRAYPAAAAVLADSVRADALVVGTMSAPAVRLT